MQARSMPSITVLTMAAMLSACATDLHDEDEPENAAEQPPVQNAPDEGESTRTVVNASTDENWVYFDLESMEDVMPASPEDAVDWDLAFQRFKIKSNGGVSGHGEVEIAPVTGVSWDALETAPSDGYESDAADGEDENEYPDYVFNSGDTWFVYDPSDHTLSPREVIYVVRSTEGDYFKLQMLEYYDSAGTAGFPSFRWASLPAPED
jgi:hypothetical protein